jgi:hypothetical protein
MPQASKKGQAGRPEELGGCCCPSVVATFHKRACVCVWRGGVGGGCSPDAEKEEAGDPDDERQPAVVLLVAHELGLLLPVPACVRKGGRGVSGDECGGACGGASRQVRARARVCGLCLFAATLATALLLLPIPACVWADLDACGDVRGCVKACGGAHVCDVCDYMLLRKRAAHREEYETQPRSIRPDQAFTARSQARSRPACAPVEPASRGESQGELIHIHCTRYLRLLYWSSKFIARLAQVRRPSVTPVQVGAQLSPAFINSNHLSLGAAACNDRGRRDPTAARAVAARVRGSHGRTASVAAQPHRRRMLDGGACLDLLRAWFCCVPPAACPQQAQSPPTLQHDLWDIEAARIADVCWRGFI